jgi:predicted ABC-type ATPase
MGPAHPIVVALAGPNGAGKSTAGPVLLRDTLGIREFVNADVIARGLSAFAPERAAMPAGRAMIARVRDLARQKAGFAFETTLAGRAYAPWIRQLVRTGYEFHLIFLWLPSAEFAVKRVADRVRLGGHGVPDPVVRRLYLTGLANFFSLYRPLATTWRVYDNSSISMPRIVAWGRGTETSQIVDPETWTIITRGGRP